MTCERCGGALASHATLPPVASCLRCGKLRVGAEARTVPQCPCCFGALTVVTNRLPITLCCPAERRYFFADLEHGLLHPSVDPFPLPGFPPCPRCAGALTFHEDLPPRATCPSCDVDYSLEPLRAAPPCGMCGGQVRILGDGAMPPQGDCIGCGTEAVLADAPEPLSPPFEITVQAVLAMRRTPWWTRLFGWLACVWLTACRGPEPEITAAPSTTTPTPAVAPSIVASPEVPEIHGRLTEVGGQRVLHVWGTPRQMGYAHGALLRTQIVAVLQDYALTVIPARALDTAAVVYGTIADIPEPLRQEAEGIIEGMNGTGGARVPGLGRDLTAVDLLVVNAMTDLLSVSCSSIAAWGPATRDDEALGGALAIVRNLDWSDASALLDNQVLIAFEPSDPQRQRVVSVAFAGYIGCLSCMSESGVTALFNMGYGEGAADLAGAMQGFAPANLLLRDALERRDVDGDGQSTAADIEVAVRAKKHVGSYLVHVVEPAVAGKQGRPPARILEVEADGVHTRTPTPDDRLGDNLLAATNHLRGKDGPQTCSRYATIERTATRAKGALSRDALWDLGTAIRLDAVVHTMLVEPAARRMTLWLRKPSEPAASRVAPVVHEWDGLFAR